MWRSQLRWLIKASRGVCILRVYGGKAKHLHTLKINISSSSICQGTFWIFIFSFTFFLLEKNVWIYFTITVKWYDGHWKWRPNLFAVVAADLKLKKYFDKYCGKASFQISFRIIERIYRNMTYKLSGSFPTSRMVTTLSWRPLGLIYR